MKQSIGIVILAILCSVPAFACTTAIVGAKASKNGHPLLWKQRDGKTQNSYYYDASGKYAYTSVFSAGDTHHKNSYGGVNEVGFAIINNNSTHIRDEKYEVKNGKVMKQALQTCRTIDDFVRMLEGMEQPRQIGSNFGVADATGAAAYIEAGDSILKRYDVPEDGWLVRTNYSVCGPEDNGSGYARYETAKYVMSRHKGKFSVEDLVNGLGRCFNNVTVGIDYSKKGKYAWDEDFIPRPSTAGSICIEGMMPEDKPGSAVMWCAPGYTPACYSIPIWVAAGSEIASPLTAFQKGNSPMNIEGEKLRRSTHDLTRDAEAKYINLEKVRSLIKRARKAEAVELKEGRVLVEKFRKEGFDLEAVKAFNKAAEKRFETWKKR